MPPNSPSSIPASRIIRIKLNANNTTYSETAATGQASTENVEDMQRFPRNTSITSCEVRAVEVFSRPLRQRSGNEQDVSPYSRLDAATSTIPRGTAAAAAATATTSVWQTVLEETSGNVWHAVAPPATAPASRHDTTISCPSKKSGIVATASAGGERSPGRKTSGSKSMGACRRLSVEGWSLVRAVVRPSDISTVLAVLAEDCSVGVGTGGGGDGESVRLAESVSQNKPDNTTLNREEAPRVIRAVVATETVVSVVSTGLSAQPAALDFRGSGAGITVRIEDDSGMHFIMPQPPPKREKGAVDAADETGNNADVEAAGVHLPLSVPVAPPQLVVEVGMGEWEFGYARGSLAAAVANKCGKVDSMQTANAPTNESETVAAEKGASAGMMDDHTNIALSMSISTLTVIDLMQRVPCHGAFRELLAISAPVSIRREFDLSHRSAEPQRRSSAVAVEYQLTSSPQALITTVSVELGTVRGNWNPRTIAAVWGVRAALRSALETNRAAPAADDPEVEAKDLIGESRGDVEAAGSTAAEIAHARSTEIRVGVRHGLEVCRSGEHYARSRL